eukprot:10960116-Ditylum_brightwellii.AAC.1
MEDPAVCCANRSIWTEWELAVSRNLVESVGGVRNLGVVGLMQDKNRGACSFHPLIMNNVPNHSLV